MSFLDAYSTWLDGRVQFSRQQASRFAKQVADDFNPIHDVDAKRFCVPGDLLFAVLLDHLGLYPRMHFTFSGMVGDGVPLHFNGAETGKLQIVNEAGKEFLRAEFEGEPNRDAAVIEELVLSYVRFSGHNFPHVLKPLMEREQVMINIDRPLVIYESMSLDLRHADIHNAVVEQTGAELEVAGKRGNVRLSFRFLQDGQPVGTGEKRMVLSGLRPYEAVQMQEMVDRYDQRKQDLQE
jgi:hypothetical protein